jgi:HlyD family secretion protein
VKSQRRVKLPMIVGMFLAASVVGGCSGCSRARAEKPARPALPVRAAGAPVPAQGRLVLSGEVAATHAAAVTVPETPLWLVQLGWLAPDGTAVKKGQKVAEFDSTALMSTLEEKRLALDEAEAELLRLDAENEVTASDKSFAVEEKRAAHAKALVDSAIPLDFQTRRDYEDKQLAEKKARMELEKAEEELGGFLKGAEAERRIRMITRDKARGEIRTADSAVEALTLRAPQNGIVVIADHPREKRKMQVGDIVWPGTVVVRLPDLSALQIEAWLFDVDDGRLARGAAATITPDAFPERRLKGRIGEIAAIAEQPSNESLRRAFKVIVPVTEGSTEGLRPGMSARIEVTGAGPEAAVASAPPRLPEADVLAGAARVPAKRDDLVVSIEMRGTLQALESEALGPIPLPNVWDYKIAQMAPEGGTAKKGATVLAFDTTTLVQRLDEKRAEGETAAKQIEKSERDVSLRRKAIELQLAEAEGKKKKAVLKVDVPEELVKAIELKKARIDLALAEKEADFLVKKRAAAERAAGAEMRILSGKKSRADIQIREMEDAIVRMKIPAPRDGTVIYLTNWRDEKKKVGDSCWRGERVMEVPDLNQLGVKAEVDESDLGRIAEGQRVTLRLDAHPDQEFTGRVKAIYRTVQRASAKNPLKVARLDVEIDRVDTQRMRPGMRVRGGIEIERVPKALVLPADCLAASAKGPVVFKASGKPVNVRVGRRSGTLVEILEGLVEGDLVLRLGGEKKVPG